MKRMIIPHQIDHNERSKLRILFWDAWFRKKAMVVEENACDIYKERDEDQEECQEDKEEQEEEREEEQEQEREEEQEREQEEE